MFKLHEVDPNSPSGLYPFGAEFLVPVDGKTAVGSLACVQGLESGEVDDNSIWDVPGTLFPEAPELPEPPSKE